MGWRLISIPFLWYIKVIRKICVRKRDKKQRTKTSVQEYPRFTSTTMYFTTHRHDMIPKTSSSNISFNPTKITYQRKGTSIKRHNQGIKGNKNKRHDLESCLCPLFYYRQETLVITLLPFVLFSFLTASSDTFFGFYSVLFFVSINSNVTSSDPPSKSEFSILYSFPHVHDITQQ